MLTLRQTSMLIIRKNNNQTLPQKLLDQSVGLQQLSRFGISNQTANALGKCTFPEGGRFKKEMPQTVQRFQIDERFEDLKEVLTAGRNRRLEPKWTEMLNEFSHPQNCYCVWVFKKHYLRSLHHENHLHNSDVKQLVKLKGVTLK